jgi:uncharacterized protein YdhG (YjbR/CyaY superfamily)
MTRNELEMILQETTQEIPNAEEKTSVKILDFIKRNSNVTEQFSVKIKNRSTLG